MGENSHISPSREEKIHFDTREKDSGCEWGEGRKTGTRGEVEIGEKMVTDVVARVKLGPSSTEQAKEWSLTWRLPRVGGLYFMFPASESIYVVQITKTVVLGLALCLPGAIVECCRDLKIFKRDAIPPTVSLPVITCSLQMLNGKFQK